MTSPGTTVLGAAALVVTTKMATSGVPGPREQWWFRRFNRDLGPLEPPMWVVMQMGNGLAAAVAPVVLFAGGHHREDAARVAVAAAGGWQLARVVKHRVRRERPRALLGEVRLSDGDPTGWGFVSGHATVAAAVAVAAAPLVTDTQRRLLAAAAGTVALARIHVGAHLPLDVVGGLGLGAVWGALCAAPAPGARR